MWSNLSHIMDWILSRRILTHILFWIGLILLYIIYGFGINQPILVSVYLKGIVLPIQIIASYIFIYKQLPQLYNRQYWRFSIVFFILTYIYQVLLHINNDFGLGTRLISYHKPHQLHEIFLQFDYAILLSIDVYLTVFVVTAIKIIKDNLESQSERAILETEKAKTEFSLIQSKIQPDYLINALQLIEDESKLESGNSPLLIEKLADVLDFSLYQSKNETVPLTQEIKTLENYLDVYAQSKKINLILDINHNITEDSPRIVPLSSIKLCESLLQNWINTEDELLVIIELNTKNLFTMKFQASHHLENALQISFTDLKKIWQQQLDIHYTEAYRFLDDNAGNSSLEIQIQL